MLNECMATDNKRRKYDKEIQYPTFITEGNHNSDTQTSTIAYDEAVNSDSKGKNTYQQQQGHHQVLLYQKRFQMDSYP